MRNAVAVANNDVIRIALSYGERPEGCMGFKLSRIGANGDETVLPSRAVFSGDTMKRGQTTAEFPIQKFYCKDVYARPVAEKTNSFSFRYTIPPLDGAPGSLTPMASLPILTTNEVELTSRCSPSMSATFNRGLISTQHVSNALHGDLNVNSFKDTIAVEGSQLRLDLSGQMIPTLTGFLKRAATSGKIYASLYELTDLQLMASLVGVGTKLNIVLADIMNRTAPAKSKSANTAATQAAAKISAKKARKTASKSASVKVATQTAAKHVAKKATTAAAASGEAESPGENKSAHDQLLVSAPNQVLYRLPPSSQDRRHRCVCGRLCCRDRKPQPRLPGFLQQRLEPGHNQRKQEAGDGLRDARAGCVRPFRLALVGTTQRQAC